MCLTVFLHHLSLGPLWSTSWSRTLHFVFHTFFTESLYSFCKTCPYHRNLFCCSTKIMSSVPSHSLNSTLASHIHLTIVVSDLCSATSFSFLTGQISLPCNLLLHTQLLYSLTVIINDISLLISNGTNCLNLFHPIRILASTAASASPSTLNMS